MEVADKAVSTEDLCSKFVENTTYLEATRLEALLKTLVQNKVNAIKNDRKCSSLYSSPKSVINRWRLTSSSTVSSKDKEAVSLGEHDHHSPHHKRRKICYSSDDSDSKDYKRSKRKHYSNRHERSECSCQKECDPCKNSSDIPETFQFLPSEENCGSEVSYPPAYSQEVWCCQNDKNGDIKPNYTEEYISLKIEDCEDEETKATIDRQRLKKKRKRRKKRHRMRQRQDRLRKIAVPINDDLKDLESDEELPPRARWTIVVTACLLLFMCLLLVGVTLRMAPIIDDMGKFS
ncbi:uncharacterized protein LOC108738893 [Agrilus planipennis]|uniref:Uncharacterized protein LOC108738893 n=1 Tax=Agrilus planipennis TaxID=224129 RepID=A0A7F5R4D6_AGRPL|nr:uncharacterized protein LOC108738893 [Agrilus planipennis]